MRDLTTLTTRLLRAPDELIDERELEALAPSLLAITALGAGIFGLVVGSYRGGVQLLYAAVKTPALLLVPVLVTLPALHALTGGSVPWRRLALGGLVGMARTAVLAAAAGPALWLLYSLTPDYHLSILAMAGTLAVCGLPGLAVVARLVPGDQRLGAFLTTTLVLGLVLAQTGWLLRPWIARPTAEVSFLRPVEADVFSSMDATQRSARGQYTGWDAKREGAVNQL